jgi:hypothetical protein
MACNYQGKIVTNGLVLCLDAADKKSYPGTGSTWLDRSGSGNHGTLVNGPTYNSSNGGSIVFDGPSDGVLLPNISPTSGLSFNIWIYIDGSNTSFGSIFANWSDGNSGRPYWIGTAANQVTTIQLYFSGGSVNYLSPVPINTWTLLTVTHTGSVCKGYINSVETISFSSSLTTSTNNTSIGFDITRSNYPFKGKTAQALIYNRALSPQEIQQNFNATRGRFGI